MARRPGTPIDHELVEQAKALHRIGHTDKFVANQLGLSISTVRRYIARPDETPAVVAARDAQFEKFVGSAWSVLHDFMDILRASARDSEGNLRKDISPRDAAWVSGVIFDKIATLEAKKGAHVGPQNQSITFNFINTGENATADSRPVSDSTELPYIDGEVSSDDMRPGSGQNVLRLPGSREDIA